MTLPEIRNKILSGELDVEERVAGFIQRIKAGSDLNAFISVQEEAALSAASRLKKRLSGGDRCGRLAGIVIGLKDLINVAGTKTTCGSSLLANYTSVYNATVVDRIIAEDGIIIGKLNLDEFGMGSTNENSAFGPVLNPRAREYVPGGSSGGAAAAVAASLCDIALGTDTGGSLRQPASFTGTVGLKPTYGRVSRYGLVAYASSLDQIGPITTSVSDAAYLLSIIGGYDPLDSTSLDQPLPSFPEKGRTDIKGLSFGIPVEYRGNNVSPDIDGVIDATIGTIEAQGGKVVEISLPLSEYAAAAYYIIATAEASSNLARYDGVRFGQRLATGRSFNDMIKATRSSGFGDEVKRRIMLGTYTLSAGYYDAYYDKALRVRRLIRDDFSRAFRDVDLILAPVFPSLPFKFGEKSQDPLSLYKADIFTAPANLAGICAISIPAGTVKGLPVGVQLIADALREDLLIQAGSVLEIRTSDE